MPCAQSRAENVVVLFAEEDEITFQLEAELSAVGYKSVFISHNPKSLTPIETNEILEQNNGVALVNVTMKSKGVEIWVASPLIHGGTLVETIDNQSGAVIDASTILKSVESLRASLLWFDAKNESEKEVSPVDKKEPVPEENTDKPPPPKEQEPRFSPGFSLAGGVSTLYGFGDMSPPLRIALAGSIDLGENISVDLSTYVSAFPMKSENHQGMADVWQSGLVLGGRGYLLGRKRWASPWIGASIGPMMLRIHGKAKSDGTSDSHGAQLDSHDDTLVTGTVDLRLGIDFRLSERIKLQVAFNNGWAFVKPEIVLGDESIPFGNPLIGGDLLLKIDII